MMKRILTILSSAFLFLLPLGVYGQATGATMLRGVVSDDLGPLYGVSVYLENADQRTVRGGVTDHNGTYVLSVPPGQQNLTLVVSFIGYKTERINYTNQTTINVTLQETSTSLGSVVVEDDAYRELSYFGLDNSTQGTSSEIVRIDELKDIPVVSVEEMLIGKVSGLDIISGGDPGSPAVMRIRGASSLNSSNQPLVVIDNIPQYGLEFASDFDFVSAEVQDYGALMNISPNDIETIEVLKDIAAAAVWGPKAANGVLVVKTKQGGNHTPTITFSERLTYKMAPRTIDMLRGPEYTTLVQDAMFNWVRDGEFDPERMKRLENQKDILYDKDWQYYREYSQDTDWVDLVTQDGFDTETSVALAGGGDKATYRFSLTYTTDRGDIKGSNYNRINTMLRSMYNFSRKFRVESKFEYSEGVRNAAYDEGPASESPRLVGMKKMPNMSPWVLDANGNPTDEYFTAPIIQDLSLLQDKMINPLALVNESTNRTTTRKTSAQFSTNYNFNSNLVARATVEFSLETMEKNKFLPESVTAVNWTDGEYNKGVESQYSALGTTMNLQLQYIKRLGKSQKHMINFSVGELLRAGSNDTYKVSTAGSGSKNVSVPSAGGKVVGFDSSRGVNRMINLNATAQYMFDERYSLTFQTGTDTDENRAANYEKMWSPLRLNANFLWKATNEKWMPISREGWLNALDVGVNYGIAQGSAGATGYGEYGEKGYYGRSYLSSTGSSWWSVVPSKMQLVKLVPEMKYEFATRVNAEFLKSRIRLGFHFYTNKTKNQRQNDAPIPSSTGFQKVGALNSGTVSNQGYELTLSFEDFLVLGNQGSKEGVDKRVRFSLRNINFSWNRNRMLEMPSNMDPENYNLKNDEIPWKIIEGTPVGAFWGFQQIGVYQDYDDAIARDANGNKITDLNGNYVRMRVGGIGVRPGDAKYVDQNNDGVIDENDIVYLGTSNPSAYGGWALNVRWRGLSLNLDMQARLGGVIYNRGRLQTETMSDGNNQSTSVLSRWRYAGDNTQIPRALWSTNYNALVSDYYVEDGSFFKLRNISLSYTLPKNFIKKIGLTDAQISVAAYNVLTLTKYSGLEPEIGPSLQSSGAYQVAIDNGQNTVARRFAATLRFTF